MMVVPSLAITCWMEGDVKWGKAPWLDEPVTAPTWEELIEKILMLRAKKDP